MTLLIGNIGSTQSELALYSHIFDSVSKKMLLGDKLKSHIFLKKDMEEKYQGKQLPNMVSDFLQEINFNPQEDGDIFAIIFGVSGPVRKQKKTTNNRNYKIQFVATIDRPDFKAEFTDNDVRERLNEERYQRYKGIPIALINDMEAIGYGVIDDEDEDLKSLNKIDTKEVDKEARKAVILVSQGLGQIVFYFDEYQDCFIPLTSEGGHSLFAARNDREIELLIYLKKKLQKKGNSDPVTNEYVLSSPGLVRIYEFIVEEKKGDEQESNEVREIINTDPSNTTLIIEKIIEKGCADKNPDALCKKAINLFLSVYGRLSGDVVLTYLSTGGLYIGGIQIPTATLQNGIFLEGFLDKERDFKEINRKVPIQIFEEKDIVLKGAAKLAFRRKYITIGKGRM